MIDRKKKLRIIQIALLILGTVTIFFTYYANDNETENKIVSKVKRDEIKDLSSENDKDVFLILNILG